MYYVDTSLVVAALTVESATARAQVWIAAQNAGELAISEWTIAEFSSALAVKLRTGQIDLDQRALAMGIFNRLLAETFVLLAVTSTHFRAAAYFSDQHLLGVRAGDALHLAISAAAGAEIATLDQRLAEAARQVGVSVARL